MNLLPYFKWYPADAESDSNYCLMSVSELGLFHRCLNRSWVNDGLPSEPEEIRRILRLEPREFKKHWPVVAESFPECEDGRRRNSRQEKERLAAKEKSNTASQSATQQKKIKVPGFLYLISRFDGLVKIGSSKKVSLRLAQLRQEYRGKGLNLLGSVSVVSMGDAEIEQHSKYAALREGGEWYRLSKDDIAEILGIRGTPDTAYQASSRAYESVYESESVSGSEEKKGSTPLSEFEKSSLVKTIVRTLSPEELDAAWEKHRNYAGIEGNKQIAYQRIISMNGTLDVDRFHERHPAWCQYWSSKGWNAFGSKTLLGWIEAGMPLPPAEVAPAGFMAARETASDRVTRIMEERMRKDGRL